MFFGRCFIHLQAAISLSDTGIIFLHSDGGGTKAETRRTQIKPKTNSAERYFNVGTCCERGIKSEQSNPLGVFGRCSTVFFLSLPLSPLAALARWMCSARVCGIVFI